MHNENGRSEFRNRITRGLHSSDHSGGHKEYLKRAAGGPADESVLNRGLDNKKTPGSFKRGGFAEGGESQERKESMEKKSGGCFKRGGDMRKASGGETNDRRKPMEDSFKRGGYADGGETNERREHHAFGEMLGKALPHLANLLPLAAAFLNEGGKVPEKKAAGGVGKIRHGEARGKGYI